jgi:Xaa-Pro dipeptidase
MEVATQTVNRVERLRESLHKTCVDVLICFKPENTFYLSGFNPIIYSHPVITIMPANGEPTLLIHALRDDHARMSSLISDVRLYGSWSTKITMGPSWLKALHTILEERSLLTSVIGFEGDYLPVARFDDLKSIAPSAEFKDASSSIFHSRVIKDPDEIANARIAAALADKGMDSAIETLAAGGSERDVTVEAMYAMNKKWIASYPDVEVGAFGSLEGGVQNALWCWCLSGKRILINCDAPSNRKPEPGEITLIYIWAAANGIYVENERSVAIGQLAPEQQKAFDCVLRARAEAQPLIKPGEPIAEVFRAIKASYERSGFGKYIPGRIGHGMGLGAHEEPSLDGKTELLFEPGMMFTFEPNLRIQEWGGLQHSDTLLITETGYESLTKTPNGFLQVQA